jgi:tripartite-type tricarboxylate transporter receptor subunit TctC
VVVENKPGGNGFIGMSAGAKAPADGYTLTMATVGDVSINPAMFKEMPYRWDDFAPISTISDAPMVWATNANMPYQSIADVLAAAKAQPGRLSVGTPGNGSINQIVMEWLALNTDTQFQHIPYKGGAPAAAALAGGDIPFGVLASSSVAPQVKAGRLRVLAVTGAHPSKFNPEWPTLQSLGVKEVDASNWTLLLAPKGTPKEIVDKLQAEVVKILDMPDVKERFAGGGVETIPSTAAELDARVKKTAQQLLVIVEKAKIKPD